MKNRLSRLKEIRVSSSLDQARIREGFISGSPGFPLLLEPGHRDLNLRSWLESHPEKFERDLHHYGSLLFRGFQINSVEKFEGLMSVFPKELLSYKLRSSPRHSLSENVYVSTTYPSDQEIHMHSESSYAPDHPERIVFCCITPSLTGGATPIADNRKILKELSASTREKFMSKGIRYRRNLNGLLGLSWQEVFQSDDREEVSRECELHGMSYAWEGEGLVLTWEKRAIWEHPVTGDLVWFNHGLFFNKYMLDRSLLDSVRDYSELPNDTFYGDGSEISLSEIEELKSAYRASTTHFPWERGDVLFLDNLLFSHGRHPYTGDRKIIVSIS